VRLGVVLVLLFWRFMFKEAATYEFSIWVALAFFAYLLGLGFLALLTMA